MPAGTATMPIRKQATNSASGQTHQATAGLVPTAAMAWAGNASPRASSSPGPAQRDGAGFFDSGIARDMGCAAATALA